MLHLGHIVSQPGHQGAGGDLVGLLEGQVHDLREQILAQVIAEALRRNVRKHAAQDATHSAKHYRQYHLHPDRNYKRNVTF